MNHERRDRILEALFQIRPGELKLTSLLFLQNLLVVGAFIVGRSVRDALFLAHGTKDQLPWMYVASACAVAVVGLFYTRLADRIRRDHLAALVALASAALLLVVRLMTSWDLGNHVFSALYVLVEVYGGLTIIQFWTLANDLFNSRDAKRLFGSIGAGGTLANIVLGAAVGVLAKRVGAENLIFLCMALLFGVAVVALRLGKRMPLRAAAITRPAARSAKPSPVRALSSMHLKLIAGLSALTFLSTTLIDFQFKTIAAASYPKDALAAFFGNFYAVTGGLALLMQFFGTSRVLGRFGVIAALAILPFFLGFGSVGMLLWPVLATATFTKGSEFVFRYTINDATTQLLYLPVAAAARAGAKGFIDGVIKPAAIAGSGLMLLAYKSSDFKDSVIPVSVASAIACLGWGLIVFRLRGEYVKTLQDTLRRRRLDLESARHRISDGATTRVLLKALESEDPREALNALELLPHTTVGNVDEQVAKLLRSPSAEVRIAAVHHLGKSASLAYGNAAFKLFEDQEPSVRAAAIEAFCSIGRDKAVKSVREFLKDPAPQVRAAAIGSMIRYGGLDGVLSAAEALKALIADKSPEMREHAAKVLGAIGVKNFYQPVLELMNAPELKVRRAAIAAAGQLKSPELVTTLIYKLAKEETASDAADALAAYGTGIESTLERVLDNPLEDAGVRRQVPRVLGALGTAHAVSALTNHLTDADETVRRSLFKALRRALRRRRGLTVDKKAIVRAVDHELERAYHALACAEALKLSGPPTSRTPRAGPQAAEALLASALQEKVDAGVQRIFTLLGILNPEAEFELIYATFHEASAADAARRRANVVELLDNVLERQLRKRLFPLIEDLARDARLRAAAEDFPLKTDDPVARLRDLLSDDSAWVRACALYLAGESYDPSLKKAMHDNLDHPSSVVREACLAALGKQVPLKELLRDIERRTKDEAAAVRERAKKMLEAAQLAPLGEARGA
ncbi:MAG: Npt1/Npt2 family nucleotide transporter [Myxococcales bacterium]